ncbi:MAG TPA: CHRD domain-containing protein [Vicinamibacterales bacterium]|nr:CHRD domain-containing protein [Vicinamibacterales bacterium]
MTLTPRLVAATLALVALVFAARPDAQTAKNFRGRLSPVPLTTSQFATIAGIGSATATLSGAKLAITGTFEGLRSPATTAQVHRAPRGLRGPVVFELTVTKSGDGTSGTIGGTFDLTPAQVTDLEKGWLYVQLQSEKAPEGNLWGWLLLQEKK